MKRSACRGSAALMVIFLAAGLTLLGTPLALIPINAGRMEQRVDESIDALALAEAGAEQAIAQLNAGTDFSTWSTACDAGTHATCHTLQIPLVPNGAQASQGAAVITVYDQATINPIVDVIGRSEASGLERRLVVEVERQRLSPFQSAIFAAGDDAWTKLQLHYYVTADSYDSRVGAYGGGNVGADADLRTNSAHSAAIELADYTTVNGDVTTAPGGDVSVLTLSTYTGAKTTLAAATFPSPAAPAAPDPGSCTNLGNYAVPAGTNLVLPETAYCFTSLTVADNATLDFPNLQVLYGEAGSQIEVDGGTLRVGQGTVVTHSMMVSRQVNTGTFEGYQGRVDLYAQQSFDIDGEPDSGVYGVVKGAQDKPENMRIYLSDGINSTVNGAQITGAIYGPGANLYAEEGTTIYGAVIVDQLEMYGFSYTPGVTTALHYDAALKDAMEGWPSWLTSGSSTSVSIKSWGEQH